MLKCIEQARDLIPVCVDDFWQGIPVKKQKLMLDADQMVSILTYSIIQCLITDINGQIKFIEEFTTESVQNSKLGSSLFTLKVAADNVFRGSIGRKLSILQIDSDISELSMRKFNEKMAGVEEEGGDIGGTSVSQESSFNGSDEVSADSDMSFDQGRLTAINS